MSSHGYSIINREVSPDGASSSESSSAPVSASDSDSDSDSDSASTSTSTWTEPTVADVFVVRVMLSRAGRLPFELIDAIIDFAAYWPHTTTSTSFEDNDGNRTRSFQGNSFLIRTPPLGFAKSPYPDAQAYDRTPLVPRPLVRACTAEDVRRWLGPRAPRFTHPCRRIVFRLDCRDQGWTSEWHPEERPFAKSYTWFDVGLERFEGGEETAETVALPPFPSLRSVRPPVSDPGRVQDGALVYDLDHPFLPDANRLQSNRVASRIMGHYTIVWDSTDNVVPGSEEAGNLLEAVGRGGNTGNGTFVRNLQLGDVVTVWAKARFPGWVNHVRRVKVKMYWAL